MITGNPQTFALEHRLLEFIPTDEGDSFYGSLAVWVAGKRFTTHDWATWLSYVCDSMEGLSHETFPPAPKFTYEKGWENRSAGEICRLVDFWVYGIGRNYEPSDEEIMIGSKIGIHEKIGSGFDAPFCDWFPIYLIDYPDETRRIILRDRRHSDALHESRLPVREMQETMRTWSAAFREDARKFRENWGPGNSHWSRVLRFFSDYFYRKQFSEELEEEKIWELQEKYARKHGLRLPGEKP